MAAQATLERILYIDDEAMLHMLVRLSLSRARGWTVETCATGAAAVVTALSCAPDLILLDSMLLDMAGEEVFKALRREAALDHVPIVFLSARCSPADQERYDALGAAGMIAKPIAPPRLADQVWEIWLNHRNL